MKLYDCATAPSPRGVRMSLAEKSISLPEIVQVNLREGEQFGANFRAINPDCLVPILKLDGVLANFDRGVQEVATPSTKPSVPLGSGKVADTLASSVTWDERPRDCLGQRPPRLPSGFRGVDFWYRVGPYAM